MTPALLSAVRQSLVTAAFVAVFALESSNANADHLSNEQIEELAKEGKAEVKIEFALAIAAALTEFRAQGYDISKYDRVTASGFNSKLISVEILFKRIEGRDFRKDFDKLVSFRVDRKTYKVVWLEYGPPGMQ